MAGRVELSVVAKNQASKVLKQVGGDIRGLSKEAGNAKSSFNEMFSVAGGNLLARGIQGATSAVLGLGKAFVGTIADAANASAQMNAQVSGIGAVLGLTQTELVKVKDLINQLGVDPNLKVNAQEAADAIDMLARNGLTLEQILGGAAEATVFLANATGGTFATSANVATDVMAMFKIGAEDMMTAVNGITSVTTASKFDIDDYNLALAQGGGVAAALGVELTDFNTTLVATASAFAGGSDAGTSFKTFLQRLVPQSNEAAEAMAELGLYNFNTQAAMAALANLGIKPLSSDMNGLLTQLLGAYAATNNVNVTTEEGIAKFNAWAQEVGFVQSAFYDTNGALKSMADISSVLAEATSGLTELQKNQYLSQIFQSDAMRTAFGLAEKGAVVYTDLATASKELGISQQELAQYEQGGITAFEALQATMSQTDALASAQMRVNNLAGDMDIFSGIVDSLRTQVGDRLQPALRTLFQTMTQSLTALSPQILAFGDSIGVGITAAVTTMLPYITNAGAIFAQFGASLSNLQTTIAATVASWQPFVASILTAVAPVASVIAQFVSWQDVMTALGVLVAGPVIASSVAALAGLVAAMAPIAATVAGAIAAVSLLRNAWEGNWGGIQERTTAAWAAIQPVIASIQSAFTTQLPAALSTVGGAFTTVVSTLDSLFGPAIGRLQAALVSAGTGLTTLGPQFSGLRDAVVGAITMIQPVITAFGAGMAAVFGIGASIAINAFTAIFQTLPGSVGAIIDQLSATITLIATTLTSVVGVVTGLLRGDFASAWTSAQSLVQGFATFGLASVTNFVTLAGLAFTSFKTILVGTFSDLMSAIGLDQVNAQLAEIQQTVTNFFSGDGSIFQTAFSVLVEEPAWLAGLLAFAWPAISAVAGFAELFSWVWPEMPRPAWLDTLISWAPPMPTIQAMAGDAFTALQWIWEGKAANIDWWGDITDGLVSLGIIGQETGDNLALALYDAGVTFDTIKGKIADGWLSVKDTVTVAVSGFVWSDFIESLTWDNVVTTALDWATFIAPLAWDALLTTLDWAAYVGKLTWDNAIVPALSWAAYIAPLAWDTIVSTLTDWSAYIAPLAWAGVVTAINWASFIGPLVWDSIITALSDWGDYIQPLAWASLLTALDWGAYVAPIAWESIVTGLTSWAAYITALDWTTIITTAIDWATWVPALSWAGFITALEWGVYIGAFAWSAFVGALDWATATGGGIDWTAFIPALTWENVVAALDWAGYIAAFTWDSFIAKLEWAGTIAKLDNWASYIPTLSWADVVMTLGSWGDYIQPLAWAGVVAALDWSAYIAALSWESVVTGLTDWGAYISTLDWTSIVTTAIDWATWIPALSWAGFVTALEWSAYIIGFTWTAFVTALDWATVAGGGIDWTAFVSVLTWENLVVALEWSAYIGILTWESLVTALDWLAFIGAFAWESFITKLEWTGTIAKLENWEMFVSNLAWSTYVAAIDWATVAPALAWEMFVTPLGGWATYIAQLSWAAFVNALGDWSQFVAAIDWSAFITGLSWAAFVAALSWAAFVPGFSWATFIPRFSWPALPSFPGWESLIPNFLGGGGGGGAAAVGQNAAGTDNWKGGWTWVGERGPELLNLPKGSQILSNTESKKMIGQLADGTTTAAAAAPKGGGNVFAAIGAAAANMGRAGDSMRKAGQTISDSIKDLEANLRKVPGLFGASQVTKQQMEMAELGIPQNFADDWLRQLTDEVVNGVNWEGVDIKDAALRAGLDPGLPAQAILELVTQKWNDKSLFANAANLDLINQDAVKAALEAQAQQAAGEQNLLGLFGVTPEQARTAGTTTGTAAGGGMLTGITQSLTGSGAGQQVATSIATGVTPESMAPVGGSVVTALATELGREEYGAQMGAALAGLFTGYLDKADAFADVAQRIMAKIAAQFSNVGALDMIARFVESFRAQLGSEEAIASLTAVGEKILELVFRGYLDEALRRNWAEGVNAKGATSGGPSSGNGNNSGSPTTTAGNAIGTSSWRGGMTWVGETGPELVSLPPRTRIFNPAESMALAGGGGGDVYVTINATVADSIDVQQMAYRVADILRKRR